jgi:glycosyltransferase involved in cell wall biosynthesis
MLENITPVILTYNEEPNIARTLDRLLWARDIVVVDSFSTDATPEIVRRVPQARVFRRCFDTHANQWNFAVRETRIESEWILALDADYIATDEFLEEIRHVDPNGSADAYSAGFKYCVWGAPLRGTLYPPVTVLFRRSKGYYVQDGHTQRLVLCGKVARLVNKLNHDDRKPLSRWLLAQDRYMRLEADLMYNKSWSELGVADRVRRLPLISPFVVFATCYLLKGGFLNGRAGLYYATQRMLAEMLLALRLIERRHGPTASRGAHGHNQAQS